MSAQATAVWVDTNELDLDVEDSAALRHRLNIRMKTWSHTFADSALERRFRAFYFKETVVRLRAMTYPWLVVCLVQLARAHARPAGWEELAWLYVSLAGLCAGLLSLHKAKGPTSHWVDPDWAYFCLNLVCTCASALALVASYPDLRDACDGDHACTVDLETSRGSNASIFFSAFTIYTTITLRRFLHFVVAQSVTVAVFLVLFVVVDPLGDGSATFALMIVVMSATMGWVNRWLNMLQRKEYVWYYTTNKATSEHLERLETERTHKQRIVGYLFHEVRNPINNIVLACESAQGLTSALAHLVPNVPEAVQSLKECDEMVEVIWEAAETASLVLNDALSLEKLQAGNFTFVYRGFDVDLLCSPTLQAMVPQFAKKQIKTKLVLDPELQGVNLQGDLKRLRQVLHNFLSNAAKFTPPQGNVVVKAEAVRWGREGSSPSVVVVVSVSDDGMGIPAVDQPKLFQPWAQIRAGENQEGGGTGLGLSLSKDFVQRGHSGEIGLRSPGDLGNGCTFFFQIDFPIVEEGASPRGWMGDFDALLPTSRLARRFSNSESTPAEPAPPPLDQLDILPVNDSIFTSPASIRRGPTLPDGSEHVPSDSGATLPSVLVEESDANRVLLVDDSDVTRRLMSKILTSLGVAHDVCENGQLAVDNVRERSYRLVLMDKEMPVMDGFEATRLIAQLRPDLAVVGVTGNALDQQRDEFLANGARQVLVKPVNKAKIEALLVRFGLLGQ